MEPEFILEQDEQLRFPRRFAGRRPLPRPRPLPRLRLGRRPYLPPVAIVPSAPPVDDRPAAVRGCGTLLVLNGFTPDQTRLSPQHYSDLLQAALLLGRVRGSVSVEVVTRGNGNAASAARARGEAVRRQLAFCLGLAGVRSGIRLNTAAGSGSAVELRVCVA